MTKEASSTPDLHIRSVSYRPHEAEARDIANEAMARFDIDEKGMVHLPSAILGELLVAGVYDGYLTGLARGISTQKDLYAAADAFTWGIEEGRQIERRIIDGYSD